MKKILITISLLAIASMSFAASGTVYTGTLEMGDISNSSLGVEVSLSPSINAVYLQPTAAANAAEAQWYAIGAGHPGGTKVYATAQNITNIYTLDISDATELTAALADIPESKVSESDWSTNGWEK